MASVKEGVEILSHLPGLVIIRGLGDLAESNHEPDIVVLVEEIVSQRELGRLLSLLLFLVWFAGSCCQLLLAFLLVFLLVGQQGLDGLLGLERRKRREEER